MANFQFSTYNGGGSGGPVAPNAGFSNRVYLTTERVPHQQYEYGGGVGGSLTVGPATGAMMGPDGSYPEYPGPVQYTKEYRTEVRTTETKRPVARVLHGSVDVDLSSPFSLGVGGSAGMSVDVGYGGGAGVGYAPPPKSPGGASSNSRLIAQSEQLHQYRLRGQHSLGLDGPDDYANLPSLPTPPPPPPPPPQPSYRRQGSTASGPLSPQLTATTYGNGGAGFDLSAKAGVGVSGGGGVRLGSASNLSGPRSPQYVNGGYGVSGGGGANYEYTVTTETARYGGRPSVGGGGSLHASQASGLDWAGRPGLPEQHQYVNYRELRDEPDSGGGGGGLVTLTRSDKFGSLGSLSGGANIRAGSGSNASLTLRSQGSGGGGGGTGGTFGLSVREIDFQDAPPRAMASVGTTQIQRVQETRQQQTQSERTVQQTRRVETSGNAGSAEFRDPTMPDLVAYLRSDNDLTVLNATAFIQHVTFADNDVKVEFFRLGGLPQLVNLLQAAVGGRASGGAAGFDLLRNLLGIVRNITFKSNEDELVKHRDALSDQTLNRSLEDLKLELCRLGALKLLRDVIGNSRDEDSREIACAAVWNLSSSAAIKPDIIDTCAETLVTSVLLPHSGLELRGDAYVSVHQPMTGTFLFYLASGVLRSVSATRGEQWRDRLRRTPGLPDCLVWPLLAAQAAQLEVNLPGLENCLCAIRNLTYACQEVADPGYVRRQEEAARAAEGDGKKKSQFPFACCGAKEDPKKPAGSKPEDKKAKAKPPTAAGASAPIIQRRMPNPIYGMDRLWFAADMAPLMHHLLEVCTRPAMLEAAAGTVQNLAACSWQPAVDFRRLFRSGGGHLLLCQLVAEATPELWTAATTMATGYRNVLQDSEAGQVSVQQVQLLASALPQAPAASKDPQPQALRRPADHLAAVIAALFSALRRETSVVAEELFRCGAVASLVGISRNPGGNIPKVVRFADALLAFLATCGEGNAYKNRMKDEFGWTGANGKGASNQAAASPKKQPPAKSAAVPPAPQSGARASAGGAGVGASSSASGGAGISIRVTSEDDSMARGQDNAGYQANTLELRGTASFSEPQYAQISKADRGYNYGTTTTTMRTTTVVQQQQQQQHQQQQEVADSWV